MGALKPDAQGRKEFLRSKIWEGSDIILTKGRDNKRFESIVNQVFSNLDLDELNKDRLLVAAYDFMVNQGCSSQDIGLFLTLFERYWNVLTVIEDRRNVIIKMLEEERDELAAEKDPDNQDPELIEQLGREIEIIIGNSYKDIYEVLRSHSDVDKVMLGLTERKDNPFAGPFIRTLLKSRKGKKGNRRYTKTLKQQLAKLLNKSVSAVAAMKAWNSGKLEGRGSTIKDVINESRSRIAAAEQEEVRRQEKVAKLETAGEEKKPLESSALSQTYSFIAEGKHAEFVRSLQPASFAYAEAHGFTREQRRWIYALFLLGPDDKEGKKQLRRHLAEQIFECSMPKVSAVTAYLSGRLRQKAEANGSGVWDDIKVTLDHLSGKKNETPQVVEVKTDNKAEQTPAQVTGGEKFNGNDPDYDNPAKERGWRRPYRKMVKEIWGTNNPLRGKRMLILESPQLKEWQMLEKMGGEERNLTIVERDRGSYEAMRDKLPKANVVCSTLFEYFADMCAERMEQAGVTRRWEILGVSRSDPRSYIDCHPEKDIFGRSGERILEGMRASEPQAFEHYEWMEDFIRLLCTRPKVSPEIPVDRGGKTFDLVSMDTKGFYQTEDHTYTLLFKLGLLNSDALLCTNFLAQREHKGAQVTYDVAYLAEHDRDQRFGWNEKVMDELSDKRDGIGLNLRQRFENGRNQGGCLTWGNPYCEFFKHFSALVDNDAVKNALLRSKMTIDFEQALADKIHPAILRQTARSISSRIYMEAISIAYIKHALETFRPYTEQLSGDERLQLYYTKRMNPRTGELLNEVDSASVIIADLILNYLSGIKSQVNRTSYEYRQTSNMASDFFHIRDLNKEVGINRPMARRLKDALFGGKMPRFHPRELIPFFINLTGNQLRNQHLNRTIRERV